MNVCAISAQHLVGEDITASLQKNWASLYSVDAVAYCMKDRATELPPSTKLCAVMERKDADGFAILHPILLGRLFVVD